MEGRSFSHFHQFGKNCARDAQNARKCCPKWCQVGHLRGQVGQHSAILATSWPILAQRWLPGGVQMEFQSQPRPHPEAPWRPEGFRTARRPASWDEIFTDFLPFRARFSFVLSRFWDGLERILESWFFFSRSFRSMLNQVSHALATKTDPRRAQNRTKTPLLAHLGHLCANILPKRSQLEANIAQDRPTCGQDRPK